MLLAAYYAPSAKIPEPKPFSPIPFVNTNSTKLVYPSGCAVIFPVHLVNSLVSLPLETASRASGANSKGGAGKSSAPTGNAQAGAIPKSKQPNTRSSTRNTPNTRPQAFLRKRPDTSGSNLGNNLLSEDRIQQIIANSLETHRVNILSAVTDQITTALRNMNLSACPRDPIEEPQLEWDNDSQIGGPRISDVQESHRNRAASTRPTAIDYSTDRPDRISNLISNWKIKFSGAVNDLPIEDFIYRVNCLTYQYFNGNFELLYQFANLLFSGPALAFYWRVHRTVGHMDWFGLCNRLRERYQDQRTDRDIKNTMRRRKQGSNESFDEFLDAMLAIADSLREPMSETDIIIEIRHNLKPELKHELLHIDTPNLAILRKECHRHEEFFRNIKSKPFTRANVPKRLINSIIHEKDSESQSEEEPEVVDEICAMRAKDKLKCWNCDELGHRYHDCLKPRRVFCYGCGLLDSYKPSCVNCKSLSENGAPDVHRVTKGDIRR